MSGRLDHLEDQTSHSNLVTLLQRAMGIPRLRPGTDTDRGAGACGKLPMARHEIGMQVGLEHPRDGEAVGFRFIEVHLDITGRIDDDTSPSSPIR